MILIGNRFFFKSARIILDEEILAKYFNEKKYFYISGLSYSPHDFGSDIVKKSRTRIIPSLLLNVTRKLTSGIFRFITQYPKNNILELYELFLTTGKIPELRKIGFLL